MVRRGGGVMPSVGADELSLGEGGGAVVLKRLSDARRDGDRVLGVIRSVGSAHHGRSRVLTAPSPDTIENAMRDALTKAKLAPDGIGYLASHTGGNPARHGAEHDAMTRVFGARVAHSSATDGAGYTLSAAGMANFLRALLAVERGQLPPSLAGGVGEWNAGRRRAGVTAWGFNGAAYT